MIHPVYTSFAIHGLSDAEPARSGPPHDAPLQRPIGAGVQPPAHLSRTPGQGRPLASHPGAPALSAGPLSTAPTYVAGAPFFNRICDCICWMEQGFTTRELLLVLDRTLHRLNHDLHINETNGDQCCVRGIGIGCLYIGRNRYDITAPWDPIGLPFGIPFAHELIHVLHRAEGRYVAENSDDERDLQEEWATIGLGPYAGDRFTDNRIRCERGWPVRTSHAEPVGTAAQAVRDEIDRYHSEGYLDPVCSHGVYAHPRASTATPPPNMAPPRH